MIARRLAIAGAALLGALALVYALWPWWAALLVAAVLNSGELTLERLDVRRPGWRELVVDEVVLSYRGASYDAKVRINAATLRYRWRELSRGRLDELSARAAIVTLQETAAASPQSSNQPLVIEQWLPSRLFERLPLAHLRIDRLLLESPWPTPYGQFTGHLVYDGETLGMRLVDSATVPVELMAWADRRDRLAIDLRRAGESIAHLANTVEAQSLRGELSVDFTRLQLVLQHFMPPGRELLLGGKLQGTWAGPLPAAVAADALNLTGVLSGKLTTTVQEQPIEIQLSTAYRLQNGAATIDVKQWAVTGRALLPAALASYLPLGGDRMAPFALNIDNAVLQLAQQPLLAQLQGDAQVVVGEPRRPLHAVIRLNNPVLHNERGVWRVDTAFAAEASLPSVRYAAYRAETLSASLKGRVNADAAAGRLQLAPKAVLRAARVRWSQGSVKPLALTLKTPLELNWGDGRYELQDVQLGAAAATARIGGGDYVFKALSLRLREVAFEAQNPTEADADIAAGLTGLSMPVGGYRLRPVTVGAQLRMAAGAVRGSWSVTGPGALYVLRGDLRHSLEQGVGDLTAALQPLQFRENGRYLPAALEGWDFPFDLSGGELAASARLHWGKTLQARAELQLKDVGGFYNLNLFNGLNTHLKVFYKNEKLRVEPAGISLSKLDVGFPISDLGPAHSEIQAPARPRPAGLPEGRAQSIRRPGLKR